MRPKEESEMPAVAWDGTRGSYLVSGTCAAATATGQPPVLTKSSLLCLTTSTWF